MLGILHYYMIYVNRHNNNNKNCKNQKNNQFRTGIGSLWLTHLRVYMACNSITNIMF